MDSIEQQSIAQELIEADRTLVQYARERWTDVWPEVLPLARMHFEQDNPSGSPKHGLFDLDVEQFELLDASGQFLILSARASKTLLGYSTWTILRDLECKGLLVAEQGPLFVLRPASGVQLYNLGLRTLREFGVRVVYPYHRLQGRSMKLGSFFTLRLGAKAIKAGYEMELG